MPDPTSPTPSKQHIFQAPTGTRDLYPVEAARRRFIMDAWRKVSINHGFEEIDGPTFEHLDLYTVKSGEGIVSELFSFERAGGEKSYALRPEFTPTLARMYAAKAASLPKPTKWFTAGPFFRAERPQRGRLREFLQWNCDVIGGESTPEARADADAEIIACCVDLFQNLGLTRDSIGVRLNDRSAFEAKLLEHGATRDQFAMCYKLADKRAKLTTKEFDEEGRRLGLSSVIVNMLAYEHQADISFSPDGLNAASPIISIQSLDKMLPLADRLYAAGVSDWCRLDTTLVRGLAYYTGTVFEVIVDNERAVAGGGRYDNLIEMFGGPPTPAVGFGMGDVVLSLVLQDKGLMPSDAELMGIAGQWPDAFVISNGTPEADAALPGVLATLRRGMSTHGQTAAVPGAFDRPTAAPDYGLHARRSYKSTKNIGKLLQDAVKCNARFAVIVESASDVTIKDMRTSVQDQNKTPIATLPAELRRRLREPTLSGRAT